MVETIELYQSWLERIAEGLDTGRRSGPCQQEASDALMRVVGPIVMEGRSWVGAPRVRLVNSLPAGLRRINGSR